MFSYIGNRLGFMLLTMFLTSLFIFVITQGLPGDTARIILGREAGQKAVESLRNDLGLSDALPLQYFRWLNRFVRGDWGTSYSTKRQILPLVIQRLYNSFLLASLTLLITIPISIGLGLLAAIWEHKWVDNVISIGSLAVVGLPEFISGLILIEILSFRFHLFPANSSVSPSISFYEMLPMLVMPAFTEVLVLLAYFTRLIREGVVNELRQSYVRTAILKGIPYLIVLVKHVLRNVLAPAITVMGLSFGWLVGGIIVTENVFNYPGLGRLLIFAIDRRDLPLMQSISMVTVICFSLANLCIDLIYALFNPQIRLGE